jgi:hypothetical protein
MTTQKLGPQTTDVEALFERIKTVTPDDAESLHDARSDVLDETLEARYETWVVADNAAWDASRYETWYEMWHEAMLGEATRGEAWTAMWDAAWYATLALCVRDLITPSQFDLLYAPWASVMEKE